MLEAYKRKFKPGLGEPEETSALNWPREYKDGIIRAMFNEPKKALQLYSAISGKVFAKDTKVEMKTLENVFLSKLRNDLAFIIDGVLIVILEHQSTLNKNMPLRSLQYILLFFQIFFKLGQALYREKLIKLPKPEFYVLYNGKASYPDEGIMKLSDAFEGLEKDEVPGLELIVKVININYDAHSRVLENNKDIRDYAVFIKKIHSGTAAGLDLKQAIKKAVSECLREGILSEFLSQYKTEVENMYALVYDENMAKEVAREEGIEIGIEKGTVYLIERMLVKGRSAESIAYDTDISLGKIIEIKAQMAKR